MIAAMLLAAVALPPATGPLRMRPGVYAPRGAACAGAGAAALRYDGRSLRDARGVRVRGAATAHGPEGFTLGRRGRGGATFVYCRPDGR